MSRKRYWYVPEIAEELSRSVNATYSLVKAEMKYHRFGRRIAVEDEEFKRFLKRSVVCK